MTSPFSTKGTTLEGDTNPFGAKPRGFAALTREERRDVASQGGRAAHASGAAHRWTSEQAAAAAKKAHANRKARREEQIAADFASVNSVNPYKDQK